MSSTLIALTLKVVACELVQVQLHQILNEVGHLLLVILKLLAIYDVLVFKVLQEIPQVLDSFLILSLTVHFIWLQNHFRFILLYVFREEANNLFFGIMMLQR